MNEKERYIEEKRENKKVELGTTYEKYKKDELISFIGFMGAAIVCGASLVVNGNLALAAGAITGCLICHKYKNGKKEEILEKRLNQEIKHLSNLKNKDQMDDKIRDKKITKVLALSTTQKSVENKYDNSNLLTCLSNALTVVGAASTFVNPWCFWLPLLGIGSNILLSNYEIKKYKAKELLENRINNLISDLDVDAIGEDNINKKNKVNENQKQVGITYNYEKEKEKQKVYTKNRN